MTRTREWLYAWLLVLPAAALLALFTHYPAVANLWHSFYSTPRANRPAKFIGLENYRALIDDPKRTDQVFEILERETTLAHVPGERPAAFEGWRRIGAFRHEDR